MKILQLIDTLHPGGAEQMAVNYANALHRLHVDSIICVTREEGSLRKKLIEGVTYYFLQKKNTFDFKALLGLKKIIETENISIVHVHGASWFFAVICKLTGSKFKLIWHDHYGQSEFLYKRDKKLLRFFSPYFDGIIAVNNDLKNWALKNLKCTNVIFLKNFIAPVKISETPVLKIKGNSKYNLICVANLRPQKDHITLLKMFRELKSNFDIALHLIGKNFNNSYGRELIAAFQKEENLYYYGEQEDIQEFLNQADIAILSSRSEGLPLALLEYGAAGLPVVCAKVGQCAEVLNDNGILVAAGNEKEMTMAVSNYIRESELMNRNSISFKKRINELYSEAAVLPEFLSFCDKL